MVGGDPAAEQRGLARARRRGEQRERAPDSLIEPLEQPLPRHERVLLLWQGELRGQQPAGSVRSSRNQNPPLRTNGKRG